MLSYINQLNELLELYHKPSRCCNQLIAACLWPSTHLFCIRNAAGGLFVLGGRIVRRSESPISGEARKGQKDAEFYEPHEPQGESSCLYIGTYVRL